MEKTTVVPPQRLKPCKHCLWKQELLFSFGGRSHAFAIFLPRLNQNQRDWENLLSAAGVQGQKGLPHCTSSRTPHPHRCCGSQPPLAQEASEMAHSKGSLSSPVQPEPPTPSLLQTEPLSSTEAAPPRNFGWFSTSAGQKKKQSKERGEAAKASFL